MRIALHPYPARLRDLSLHGTLCRIVRTTVEIRDTYRATLRKLAARRGRNGFAVVLNEAIEQYIAQHATQADTRQLALKLRGTLPSGQARRLRADAAALRRSWRS
jgi:hypothetical protein